MSGENSQLQTIILTDVRLCRTDSCFVNKNAPTLHATFGADSKSSNELIIYIDKLFAK